MNAKSWLPFLRWLPRVNRTNIKADIIAGLTGAIVVLPQGVAFATIAGMPPQYGLYAGMVPAIIAALFGSSWHLVSGPTTAASIVLFAVLSPLAQPGSEAYIQLALTLTLMVGLFQLVMGISRMGAVIHMISHSVIVGFTAGAALLIMISQLKNFFGLEIEKDASTYSSIWNVLTHLHQTNHYVLLVSLATLLVAVVTKKKFKKIPYMLSAMVIGSVVAWVINRFSSGSEQLVSTVESLPAALPALSAPLLNFETIELLAPAAFIITLLALTEATSIARSIALKSGQNIDTNQECIGQGLSNLVGSFASAYVATGSFNRSAINYESGARTPVAAILAGLLLIVIVVLIAPITAYLPHAAMAGILMLVGWTLIDFYHIRQIIKTSKADTWVLAITFFSTLLVGLEFAIVFGVVMGAFLFLMNSMRPKVFSRIPDADSATRKFKNIVGSNECPQVKCMRVDGSIYFGSLYYIKKIINAFRQRDPDQKHLLLLSQSIVQIDISGAEFLAEQAQTLREEGGQLYIYKAKDLVKDLLKRGGYYQRIGEENFFEVKSQAIETIFNQLDRSICTTCHKRVFIECQSLPPPTSPPPEKSIPVTAVSS